MKTTTCYVTVKVCVEHPENVAVEDVLNDADYSFQVTDSNHGRIASTEIVEYRDSIEL